MGRSRRAEARPRARWSRDQGGGLPDRQWKGRHQGRPERIHGDGRVPSTRRSTRRIPSACGSSAGRVPTRRRHDRARCGRALLARVGQQPDSGSGQGHYLRSDPDGEASGAPRGQGGLALRRPGRHHRRPRKLRFGRAEDPLSGGRAGFRGKRELALRVSRRSRRGPDDRASHLGAHLVPRRFDGFA